jgi:hypothetical protein
MLTWSDHSNKARQQQTPASLKVQSDRRIAHYWKSPSFSSTVQRKLGLFCQFCLTFYCGMYVIHLLEERNVVTQWFQFLLHNLQA